MNRSFCLGLLAGGVLWTSVASARATSAPAAHGLAPTSDVSIHLNAGAPEDTSRVVQLPEVVSTANRFGVTSQLAPSPVYLLEGRALQLSSGHLLSSSLQPLPGVFLKTYGGGSSLQTISMRGMSPENTLVLLDGLRINSPQNGQVDLGFLLPGEIDRVEVAPGGFSSLYGSDAVGGVVNVVTRKSPERFTAAIEQSIGSSGYQGTRLSAGGSAGDFGVSGSVRRESARGNYRYLYGEGIAEEKLERNGNDFRILDAQGRFEWHRGGEKISFTAFYNEGRRGIGSAVMTNASVSTERLNDRSLRFILASETPLSDRMTLRLSGQSSYTEESYEDWGYLNNGLPYRSESRTRYLSASPLLQYEGGSGIRGVVGGEFSRAWLTGVDLLDANRYQQSVFISTEHLIGLPFVAPFEAVVYPSIRYDNYTDAGNGISPRLGLNLGLVRDPSIRIRGSFGRSLRVPSFNDLYWGWGGNPELKPERSTSYDLGVSSAFEASGTWRISGTFYRILTRDRILWIPSGGMMWVPQNVGEVLSRGFEGEVGWRGFGGLLDLSLNSTWANATKRSADYPGDPTLGKELPYVPSTMVKGIARITLDRFMAQVEFLRCGRRFTTGTNDKELPPYTTASIALRYDLPVDAATLFVKGEVANLFGESYQVIALYPMPLRELRLTIGGTF